MNYFILVSFLNDCIKTIGKGFHPDTNFSDYINLDTKKETFSPTEADQWNDRMENAFNFCEANGIDIYEVALKVLSFRDSIEYINMFGGAEAIAKIEGSILQNFDQFKAFSAVHSGGGYCHLVMHLKEGKIITIHTLDEVAEISFTTWDGIEEYYKVGEELQFNEAYFAAEGGFLMEHFAANHEGRQVENDLSQWITLLTK